jgi:predicted nuclease of predicted toxin-antitoxin system
MSQRFLVDANLPAALARHLTAEKYECVHVFELDGVATPDIEIWALATTENRTIITETLILLS